MRTAQDMALEHSRFYCLSTCQYRSYYHSQLDIARWPLANHQQALARTNKRDRAMPRPAPATIIGPKVEKPSDRAWWKSATVYQIYPVSSSAAQPRGGN